MGRVWFEHWSAPCALGSSGISARKREGDGATPIGRWPIRQVFYRPDKNPCFPWPRTLACRAIESDLGWCDAVDDRNYNRVVRNPYPGSAEHLWRDDPLYDVVLVLGYNDRPRVKARGSAIFMHVADEDQQGRFKATAGCVALRKRDLSVILSQLHWLSHIQVHA